MAVLLRFLITFLIANFGYTLFIQSVHANVSVSTEQVARISNSTDANAGILTSTSVKENNTNNNCDNATIGMCLNRNRQLNLTIPVSKPTPDEDTDSTYIYDDTSTPEPESRATSEGEEEPDSEHAEPEDTPGPEPEAYPEVEPMPEWSSAMSIWQEAWPIHVYMFGSLFLIMGIVTIIMFGITLSNWKKSGKKILTISLTVLLTTHALTRTIVLLVDPYRPIIFPYILWRFLWVWTYPCLTSALCILLAVLLDTTKMTLGPPRFQKLSSIAVVIIGHFTIIAASEVIVYYFHKTKIITLLCQLLTALWGLTLVCSFGYILFKLSQNLKASSASSTKDKELAKILSMRRTILVLIVVGAIYSGTYIYGAVGVFGVLNATSTVEPWPWWSFQTLSRIEELCMAGCILIVIGRTPAMASSMRGVLTQVRRKCTCCVAAVPRSIQQARFTSITTMDGSGFTHTTPLSTSNRISPEKASIAVTAATETV